MRFIQTQSLSRLLDGVGLRDCQRHVCWLGQHLAQGVEWYAGDT